MKQDRFLWGIVGGSLLLIVIAVLVARGAQQAQVFPDDTPAGVTYNYFLALQQGDLRKAYGYLSARARARVGGPDALLTIRIDPTTTTSLRVDDVSIGDSSAHVRVTIFVSTNSGLFGGRSEYTRQDVTRLVREGGDWKIDQYFYPYWSMDWN